MTFGFQFSFVIWKKKLFFHIIERLGLRTWRADLEVLHRMVGLFNKVQLCLFSRLTKERCIAIYLFSRWVYEFRRRAGWLNTGLYIKASATCLMRYYGGSFDRSEALPHPISLTRCGLPRRLQPLLFIVRWSGVVTIRLTKLLNYTCPYTPYLNPF